jgi:hypothetical protein
MRVHALLDPSLCCESLDRVTDVGGINGMAVERAEKRGAALDSEGLPLFQPTFDEGEGTSVKAHRASAISLAVQNAHRAVFAVDVLGLQRQCLGDAKTTSVEDGKERGVANARRCAARAGSQQAASLVGGQGLRR